MEKLMCDCCGLYWKYWELFNELMHSMCLCFQYVGDFKTSMLFLRLHNVYFWQTVSLPVCLCLVEEIEQMNSLFQQKQRELVVAASKVEELSRQLDLLKHGKMDNFCDNQSSVAELDRLYKELQVGADTM